MAEEEKCPDKMHLSSIFLSPKNKEWLEVGGIRISAFWFKQGFLVFEDVETQRSVDEVVTVSHNTPIDTIFISEKGGILQHSSLVTKPENRKKYFFGPSRIEPAKTERLKVIESKLDLIRRILLTPSDKNQDVFLLLNRLRRDEIFIRTQFNFDQKQASIYLNLTLSKSDQGETDTFSDIQNFVTCSCLFGAELVAEYSGKKRVMLIDHHRQWSGAIKDIAFELLGKEANEDDLTLYEQFTLKEHEKYSLMMSSVLATKKSKPANVFFHLPYLDYILYLFNLYLRKIIENAAFNKAVSLIMKKRKAYSKKIQAIYAGFELKIGSPFDELFCFSKSVEDLTGDDFVEFFQEKFSNASLFEISESVFVSKCLELLTNKKHNSKNYEIWQEFRAHARQNAEKKQQGPDTLEVLLHMANAIFVLTVSGRKVPSLNNNADKATPKKYDTICIQPRSEGQIPAACLDFLSKDQYRNDYNGLIVGCVCDTIFVKNPENSQQSSNIYYYNGPGARTLHGLIKCKILDDLQHNMRVAEPVNLAEFSNTTITTIPANIKNKENPPPISLKSFLEKNIEQLAQYLTADNSNETLSSGQLII